MGIVLLLTSLGDRPALFQIVMSTAVTVVLLAQSYALLGNVFGLRTDKPEQTSITE